MARSCSPYWRCRFSWPVAAQATIGLDTRTQRKVFEVDQAGYTPMVSDSQRLYLIGYFTLVGLQPKR